MSRPHAVIASEAKQSRTAPCWIATRYALAMTDAWPDSRAEKGVGR
jgi:hypothetical protein